MRWLTYFAVCGAVISVGLALGISLPLVSLRLEAWGFGTFAIGVMAAMPAVGILVGSALSGRLAQRLGSARLMRLCLLSGAVSVGLLALWPHYSLWLLLRLWLGMSLTVVFILGESWINQLAVEHLRGRLVALYGTGYALSQLCGPLLLGALGSESDTGFWCGVGLLVGGALLLVGRDGAPEVSSYDASLRGLLQFCRSLPAIAWAVALFAAFESMVLTLLPVYGLRQGFAPEIALLLFHACALTLLLSSLGIPALLHTPFIWPLWVLFGASAGGLFTLSLILIGERYRDSELVRANAHVSQLWGIGCLLGPLATGAASQWISGHALPLLMALGAGGLVVLLRGRHGLAQQASP
jgi:MFS family permease